jgi:hypothetical protein
MRDFAMYIPGQLADVPPTQHPCTFAKKALVASVDQVRLPYSTVELGEFPQRGKELRIEGLA